MNTFKRKALFTAVVAGFGTIGTAEAVFQSPLGTGQALVFPYYTVQQAGTNAWNTYISVVNTAPEPKAVKVRILEGRASQEVLDFNLFLSANDVWTAAIVPVDATASSGGKIITADLSCTAPEIVAGGIPFRNLQYQGAAYGGAGKGLDRTREGYIEMIEMGTLSLATATAITHVSGVPKDCTKVRVADYTAINATDVFDRRGGLTGTGTLINVNSGLDVGYKADALEAYDNTPGLITGTGATVPALADVVPAVGIVFNNGYDPVSSSNLTVYAADFSTFGPVPTIGALALASVYMHESVLNEYVLDSAAGALTDWVITQPIKNFFVDNVTAYAPYTEPFTASGACELVEFTYFDREERSATAGGIDFSPPLTVPGNSICWESTVLSIRNGAGHMPTTDVSGVLGSRNATSVKITDSFQNGWARLRFIGLNATTTGLVTSGAGADSSSASTGMTALVAGSAGPYKFVGLPATGFMVRTFANGTLTCGSGSCQGNYSALFNHSYNNNITP